MPTVRADAKEQIERYIAELPQFSKEITTRLRQIIFKAVPEITEDWKWGPNYQYPAGNMICGYGAAKGWVTFTFFNGAALTDPKKLFNYGDMNAHNRSIKFTSAGEIDEPTLVGYLQEAVQLIPSKKEKPELVVPQELKEILSKDKKAGEIFNGLPYTHRKEYIVWVTGAKKEETRTARLNKITEMLLAGKKEP